MTQEATVFIVDDDEAVRDSLEMLMISVGLKVKGYDSALAFLENFSSQQAGCLILDIRMPKMNGLELQEKLNAMQSSMPIIFISGHGDVPMAVQAMQRGAIDFLQKPFRDQELLDRVQAAIEEDKVFRSQLAEKQVIASNLAKLTAREEEVLSLIVAGKANKVIAFDLELSQRTVELHRSHIMEKMQTHSLAQLVRMVILAQTQ